MAVPTNTFRTYGAVGAREDLSDIIYNISPTDTPFMSGIGKEKATNTYTEWQIDSLAAADGSNAQLEGDDAAPIAITPTTRAGNYTQISTKTVSISGTEQAVGGAGRKNPFAYELAKKGKEIKRDMEAILTGNQVVSAGSNTVARKLRPLEGWYATNALRGVGGANGSTSAAATDGTQRPFTEDLLKSALQSAYIAGGNPDMVMLHPSQKTTASGFTGNATRTIDANDKRITSGVLVYGSDFGDLDIVMNRFQRARTVHISERDMWAVSYLRPFFTKELAVTGDSEKKEMIVEYTLIAKNEAANAVIADLTVPT